MIQELMLEKLKKIKDLANYFGNVTEEYDENGTLTEMRFKNVSYTELKSVCYNVTENGTILNEIPMINGLCDELSSVDYFGQQYGIDTIQFGDFKLNGTSTNYSVDADIFSDYDDDDDINRRRRLFFKCCRRLRRFFKKVKKVVVKVVKKVVQVVKDVIDILKGDINKRIFEVSLSIDAANSYTVSGSEDTFIKNDNILVGGTFEINSGVEFYSGIHCDLVAKYKIFDKNPSFDLFRLTIGGETRFKAYINILIDGTVNIIYKIAEVQKKMHFLLGPIPVVVRPYVKVQFGLKADVYLDFALEFGYKPTSFEYGIEWNKNDGGWNTINKPLVFEPYKNFGSEMEDDQSCLQFVLEPYIRLSIGVIFADIVDVSIIPTISLITQFQYPSTCDSVHRCDHDPLQASFGIDFQFSIFLGLEVGILGDVGKVINLPSIVKLYELPFNIPSVRLFDKCFETNIDSFSLIGDLCCTAPTPEPTVSISPTPSPTALPSISPTPSPTANPTEPTVNPYCTDNP